MDLTGTIVMESKCFWSNWLVTLGTTGLLFVWSLPLSPFSTPGMRANEAVIIFLPLMLLRWLALAILLWQSALQWAPRLRLSSHWGIGMAILVLVLHLVLGSVNLGVMNLWLSVAETKTRAVEIMCVVVYFGLPLLALALCTALRVAATQSR